MDDSGAVQVPVKRRKRAIYQAEIVTNESVIKESTEIRETSSVQSANDRIADIYSAVAVEEIYLKEDDIDQYDEEEEEDLVMFKPVFVPRKARNADAVGPVETDINENTDKRQETVKALAIHLHNDRVQRRSRLEDSDQDLIDDTDEVDNDTEYNKWKLRELVRIKRDRKERDAALQEQKEILARREMDDNERRQHDLEAGIDRFSKQKSKMQYMQKYYHKGAFYQDETEILQRDYSQPTALENATKVESLPQLLQVRDFGKAGRSKWTHLANEDTSKKV